MQMCWSIPGKYEIHTKKTKNIDGDSLQGKVSIWLINTEALHIPLFWSKHGDGTRWQGNKFEVQQLYVIWVQFKQNLYICIHR